MKLIDEVKAEIERLDGCSAGVLLAEALASACDLNRKVSLLEMSSKFDIDNKNLAAKLIFIRKEPDYSSADQDAALRWLKSKGYIES